MLTRVMPTVESFIFLGVNVCGQPKIPDLWGRNLVGSNFYFKNKYETNACINVHGDDNSWARVTHEHRSPTNNDDSTVFLFHTR